MRGKRSKQYRKLMQQYALHFGFREPYQVLVDADVLADAMRFKMNFASMLEKSLHGAVKLMITQCSMRHLYGAKPKNDDLITHAQAFERRRCDHHELENPLSTFECFKSVIDPKDNRANKHRYIVVTQDPKVRAFLRTIPGVPLIYLKRSVMIMEPMAGATERVVEQDENKKFRLGLKARRSAGPVTGKRRREEDDDEDEILDDGEEVSKDSISRDETISRPASKVYKKVKGPNPLSVMKKKAKPATRTQARETMDNSRLLASDPDKRKRKRKHHHKTLREESNGEIVSAEREVPV